MKLELYDRVIVLRNFLNELEQQQLFDLCITDPLPLIQSAPSYRLWFHLNDSNVSIAPEIQVLFACALEYIQNELKNRNTFSDDVNAFDTRFYETHVLEQKEANYYNAKLDDDHQYHKITVIGISYYSKNGKQPVHTDKWSNLNMTLSLGKSAYFSFKPAKENCPYKKISIASGDIVLFPGNEYHHSVQVNERAALPSWCLEQDHFKLFSRFNLQMRNMVNPPRRSMRLEDKNLKQIENSKRKSH
ncbi:MAG: alpha-ketoglutarate-dependent dioxygenase AlkB [Gammaproteobacteria bacterium]|nr:alpha-ketoglutarate-dependent dioxygenase AlkB [Gammaproteobacteria bacterium]